MLDENVIATPISGYTVSEVLYENATTIVYRAIRLCDRHPVILKTVRSKQAAPKSIQRLKHEYELLKHLKMEGVSVPLALELPTELGWEFPILVFSDDEQVPLNILLQERHRSFSLTEILSIALQIAETLGQLHEQRIIHKDLNPGNIVVQPQTLAVKIIDFGIASILAHEGQSIRKVSPLEGTLAYLSPEQTGRMNRSIDNRSDFYSLGATLYELLTGRVPFTSRDPIELVHCHIAQQPIPPHQIKSSIPEPVSAIVMKLLAKTAEDRYQSAYGLKSDLQTCLTQWNATGQIAHFSLGQQDLSSQFQLTQKLYGREAEVSVLMSAFDRASRGRSGVVLVSGYSGVGKSLLIHEVHKPITQKRGYFISGKFDQFKRNIPYVSLIQAFQELIRQLLTESETQIQTWREKLLIALEGKGQILIDVIPEVELILGGQPPVPLVSAAEAQSRFHVVFQQFIQVFTQKEHPLVLLLDDLQWADAASLKLVQALMTQTQSQHFLLIGAYRENEVNSAHPLVLWREEMQKSDLVVQSVLLKPLSAEWTHQLVADTLHCPLDRAKPLGTLIFNRTHGNPFFANQLLEFLYREQHLVFSFQTGAWQWDMPTILNLGVTDDVVELMMEKIQKLSAPTQDILKLAACVGNQFDLAMLARVVNRSAVDVARSLWEALQEGLVIPIDHVPMPPADAIAPEVASDFDSTVAYRFLHDRVQQAAHALMTSAEQQTTHLTVARLMAQQLSRSSPRDELRFDLVNHYNLGSPRLTDAAERLEVAHLNLSAGQKAKASAAFEPALKYFKAGIALLPENSWSDHYALTFELYSERAECDYLCGRFESAEACFQVLLSQVKSAIETVEIYIVKMMLYINQNHDQAAIDLALEGLSLLNCALPHPATETDVQRLDAQIKTALRSFLEQSDQPSMQALMALPPMQDLAMQHAMQLLQYLAASAIRCDRHLYNLAILKMVEISLSHGNCANSAYAYVAYGTILGVGQGAYFTGHQFGKVALELSSHFRSFEGITNFSFGGFLGHWKEPLRRCKQHLIDAFQYCYSGGDLLYAVYALGLMVDAAIISGEPLEDAAQDVQKFRDFATQRHYRAMVNDALVKRQFVATLQGKTIAPTCFSDEQVDEAELVARLQQPDEPKNALSRYYIYKSQSLYLFGEDAEALKVATQSAAIVGCHFGVIVYSEHFFWHSLIVLAAYETAEALDRTQYWQIVESNQTRLQQWVEHCPENFLHKYQLVAAEMAWVEGDRDLAGELYDQAIDRALESGFVQVAAIAAERAAKRYLSLGRSRIAATYLGEAQRAYQKWGATAKVTWLRDRYRDLLPVDAWIATGPASQLMQPFEMQPFEMQPFETVIISAHPAKALDWLTVIKASQMLSSEIVFDRLMEKLMNILIENAGAQRGVLLAKQQGALVMQVKGDVEGGVAIVEPYRPSSADLPLTLINYVERTRENVVLDSAVTAGMFMADAYVVQHRLKSVLCFPIVFKGNLMGVLYLENNLTIGAFTPERLEVLKLLTAQVSISIENASLYSHLQQHSQELERNNAALERSRQQLKTQAQDLQAAIETLKNTQTQLVQTEKMSSLGQLVAGVAHEINNPVNFVSGNIACAQDYVNDLLDIIAQYQQHYPDPIDPLQETLEDLDLEFIVEDLPKLLNSMALGTDRIRNIVLSLRNFSRVDQLEKQPIDIHEGLESTLLILQLRLKANQFRPAIEVVKEYGNIPPVECYAGQLNQVFMNLIANAIDALDEHSQHRTFQDNEADPSRITIRTETIVSAHQIPSVLISIGDNGPGMTPETQKKLFEAFYTTKPVGKGTGLGLSITYQIITEKHGGRLACESVLGEGATFWIELPLEISSEDESMLETIAVN